LSEDAPVSEASTLFPEAAETDGAASGAIGGTGVLPYQAIRALERAHAVAAIPEIEASQLQPASMDLRLGHYAYRVRASFLPGEASVLDKVDRMGGYRLDLESAPVLEKGCVYVIPLLESLDLPADVTGLANPKSTTGRLDILTRLITDRGTGFDQVDPGYKGPLYVEVAPQTFSIVVRPGSRLNQLRLHRGRDPRVAAGELRRLYEEGQLVGTPERRPLGRDGLVPVTIDLKGRGLGSVIGYRAKKHTDKIDIDLVGAYDPHDYWERIEYQREASLILDPGEFYILATAEEVGVPPHLAAEMVPYHTRSGEYRVHYAGFFDPGFGWNGRAAGSRAVLEVRSHDVPFMLEHGQTVGWLRYESMAAKPDRTYGTHLKSNYQNQSLALAKQFRPFAR
jgi:dCTP deaminase